MQIIRVTFIAACAIVLASCGIDKTELTMVLPTEAVDRSIVEELDAILDAGSSVGLQFTGESLAGEDALDAIAAGDADLALVSNYLPFRDDIATIMPLYPTVLHIGINKHRTTARNSGFLPERRSSPGLKAQHHASSSNVSQSV